MPSPSKTMNSHSQVRIIAGKWRSRKISFPIVPGLRPTPDRVRETVFNWLSPILPGARCLDLFAGSGALSFESLSRGAHSAVMIDNNPLLLSQIQNSAEQLTAIPAVQLMQALIPHDLDLIAQTLLSSGQKIDIVFLDPPFDSAEALLKSICFWLSKQKWLNPMATIYIESPSSLVTLPIPSDWKLSRQKKAGQVIYSLFKTTTA